MADNWDFNTIASRGMQKPNTIASATTVAPITKLTFLTGTVQLANITPLDPNAYQEVTLCFTNAAPGAFLTNGTSAPIKVAYQPIQNRPIDLCWDPSSKYWWPKAVV
jgi:hypothetical protein